MSTQCRATSPNLRIFAVGDDRPERIEACSGYSQAVLSPKAVEGVLADIVCDSHGRLIILDAASAMRSREEARTLGAQIASALRIRGLQHAVVDLPAAVSCHDVAIGAQLGDYHFPKNTNWVPLDLVFTGHDVSDAKRIAEAIALTRDIANSPSNSMTPDHLAQTAKSLEKFGIVCRCLDSAEIELAELNGISAVGNGSSNKPRLIVLEWNRSDTPILIVSAGLSFDAGGLSLRSPAGMEEMGHSLAGPAAVLGVMQFIAEQQLSISVTAVVAVAENLPSGSAARPGDIIKLKDGRSIELRTADAALPVMAADTLAYALDQISPRLIIDIGSYSTNIIAALGFEFAGCFSNNKNLEAAVALAGELTGEKTWALPFDITYDGLLESPKADVVSIPRQQGIFQPPEAVAIARLLRPLAKEIPWVHLNITGVGYPRIKPSPTCKAGAPGYGVALLSRLLQDLQLNSTIESII